PISRYAQVRVAWHNIALKRGRSNPIMTGSGLGPAEMKHRACISQIQSEMSVLRMPVEIDNALANADMFDIQRLPRRRNLRREVQHIVPSFGFQAQHAMNRCGKKC